MHLRSVVPFPNNREYGFSYFQTHFVSRSDIDSSIKLIACKKIFAD